MRTAKNFMTAVLLTAVLLCNMIMPVNAALGSGDTTDSSITLLSKGSTWKYLDNGSDQGTAWKEPAFNDGSWSDGKAPLGYPGTESNPLNGSCKITDSNGTVISYGPDSNHKYATTYFRTTFEVSDLSGIGSTGVIEAGIDDAAVIYLNGYEIARTNLPAKEDVPEPGYDSYVSDFSDDYPALDLDTASEGSQPSFSLGADEMAYLVEGENVLAAEVHQGRADSSDVYWDMEFSAAAAGSGEGSGGDDDPPAPDYEATDLTFAPGQNAAELNFAWYSTVQSADCAVQVAEKADMTGSDFPVEQAATFTGSVSPAAGGFYANKVVVTGLEESTAYVYRVGDGDSSWSDVYSFNTYGTESYSFLAVGDVQIGAGNTPTDITGWNNTMAKAMEEFPEASFLLSLGDQVETNSNEAEYTGFFSPPELRNLPVAPLLGNHDNGAPNYSYHFNLPNLTTHGATNPGSSDYYFTYGNLLVMVINSNNTSGAQHGAFIAEAVEANPDAAWRVVMFHHDIYGSASHSLETGIINLRNALFPYFDQYDVDLVLTGHDHSYTRTYPMYNDQPLPGQNSLGTVYMTLNSGSGSKYYGLQAIPEYYAAVREQLNVPTFSKFDVTPDNLTVSTYRTDTLAETDTFTIAKEAHSDLDLVDVTVTADKTTLDTGNPEDSIQLSPAATDSGGDALDLSGAYVLYKTADADILAVGKDGKVTVKNAPVLNQAVKVWAEVFNGESFVKSNELEISVTVPHGLAAVTLTADDSVISGDSELQLSLAGIDTTGADMDLSAATVVYQTDKAGILAISADGKVTVQNQPDRNTTIKITAEVTLDGKTVTSNILPITVSSGAGFEIVVPVQTALDDTEERADGSLDYDSSDLEITWETPANEDKKNQKIGIRFSGLNIPQGATITDAYIQFTADYSDRAKSANPFDIDIYAEDVADSAAIENVNNVISGKLANKTAASVNWTISGTDDDSMWQNPSVLSGTAQQTPNLAALVQHIVNKEAWESGNALTFLLTGEGNRTALAYEGVADDSQKPTLHVKYATTDVGIPISEARMTPVGETATVTGIVSVVNPTTTGSYFLQDGTAGICMYVYSDVSLNFTPKKGDKIQVTGAISPYKGLLEITPAQTEDVILKSEGNPVPEPREVTLADFGAYQSELVKIKNVTIGTINVGGNTTVTDEATPPNSSFIYKTPALTGISAGDKVDITAISAYYNVPELILEDGAAVVKAGGTIQDARNQGVGQTVEVSGVVTYATANNYYIQDSTAGLLVYAPGLSPLPQQGDIIKVNGALSLYHGILEISSPASVTILSDSHSNPLPEPQTVTITQLKDQISAYESERVKIENVTLGAASGNYTSLSDGDGNTINIYKMPALTGINPGDTVTVIAVASLYDSPQLCVQNASDISKGLSGNDKIFDFVEITDLHGYVGNDTNNQIAAVTAQNIKNTIEANNPDRTLILANGDNYQGTAISNLQYGEVVMEFFNYLGVDASAVGNHEFDWGLAKVTNLDPAHPVAAQYPTLCANLFPKGNTTDPVFDPYQIFTLDGVKIAVVSGLTESAPNIVLADNIKDYDVLSNVTYINQYVQEARAAGAQIVIALIHEGDDYNNGASGPIVDIAKNLVGVDAVLGGHTHDIVQTTVTTNAGKTIPLAIGNCNGNGYIDLKVVLHQDGTLSFPNAGASYVAQNTTSTVYPYGFKAATPVIDQNVKQLISQTMAEQGPILNEVIGSAQKNLTRSQAVTPYGESLAGNWATDVMRNTAGVDFAFQNNGGLRCDIPQGQLTMAKMYEFMPFDNVIVTCDMTGAQLKVILEEAVADGGYGIQLSGMSFSYDRSLPSGSRVYSAAKSDGTAIDLSDTTTVYKAATNDFLYGGTTAVPKDGFSFSSQSSNMADTHILVRDDLANAVRAAGTAGITAALENRITNGPMPAVVPAVKFAVISDVHYYDPALGTSGSAFEAYLASDRKLIAESKAILESAIAGIINSDAQIVLVCGDLTKDGELVNHQQLAEQLRQLEDAGKKVYVIDGNHDINNPHAFSYSGDQATPIASATPAQFKEIYGDFGYDEAVAQDPNSLSYAVEPVPGLRIIAMDSVLYDDNIANGTSTTAGAFSAERLAWINAQIEAGAAQGKTVIGMMHHGVTNHFSLQSAFFPEYVIDDAANVAANLSSRGMKAVFTGHFHAQDITKATLPGNQFLFDVETGSLVTSPVPFRLVDLTGEGKLYVTTNRITGIDYNTGGQDFQTYAEDYLREGLDGLVPQMLAGVIRQIQPGLTPDQALAAANNACSQQVTPFLTVKDCLVNVMVAHYQGDETADSQLLAVYQSMAASADALTQTLGGALLSLSTDLLPADNRVILDLNSGESEQLNTQQYVLEMEKAIVEAGEKTNVTLWAMGAQDLRGFDLTLKFDPDLFAYESVTVRDDFKDELGLSLLNHDDNGNIHIVGVLLGEREGLSGDLDLLTIKLKAKEQAAAGSIVLVKGSLVHNGVNEDILIQDQAERIVVAVSDISGNGKTELQDLIDVARKYGKTGDPVKPNDQNGYQAALDMDKDGDIDIVDVIYVGEKVLLRQAA
jgi:2',3'-cyclic-nucleotide 2'-phosphodiesterase (5'-nucleotidase family)/3',5'-cyclic AMP phosphodiesterase CpdA